MIYTKPVSGTLKKVKMSWLEYIFTHLIPTWFRSFGDNFRMWADLMTGNYENYALLKGDDPYEECYQWFWTSINLDETLPKEFLEYLQQMVNDIESGKEKVIPLDEDFFDRIKDLIDIEDLEEDDGDV